MLMISDKWNWKRQSNIRITLTTIIMIIRAKLRLR